MEKLTVDMRMAMWCSKTADKFLRKTFRDVASPAGRLGPLKQAKKGVRNTRKLDGRTQRIVEYEGTVLDVCRLGSVMENSH